MPRILARLIPTVIFVSVLYAMWLLGKSIQQNTMSKRDRTRLIFLFIVAIVGFILLFSVTITEGI